MLRKTLLALAVASALVACGKSSKEPEKAGTSASATASAGKGADKDAKKEPLVTLQMSP
jgi:membrane fusion protein (multidrug efflux system)